MPTVPFATASWLEQVALRAERHAAARPERWRRLGFEVPGRPGTAQPSIGEIEWPRVSVVLPTHRVCMIENCRRNVLAQDYPNLDIVIVLNNDAFDTGLVREISYAAPRVFVVRSPLERNLGSCINLGVAHASGAYVARMDDDDLYGPSYISDLLLSALESEADITGKKASFLHFDDVGDYYLQYPELRHRWLWPGTDETGCFMVPPTFSQLSAQVTGATLFVKRDLLLRFPFDETKPRSADALFQVTCRRAGMTIYASDEFNYCCRRRAGGEDHLEQVSKDAVLQGAPAARIR
jgi:hypothetical protein